MCESGPSLVLNDILDVPQVHFRIWPTSGRTRGHILNEFCFLQEVLNKVGAVLWLDIQYTFKKRLPSHLLKRAERDGLVMWKVDHPTSSLTHQKMFDYFRVSQVYYYFHRMVESSHLILYNTETVHYRLMLPWVRCALTLDCIAPIGSQRFGCRFNKKPLYRYSGCHRYDMSALNVVLGLMYNFDSHSYAAGDKDKFFGLVKQEFVSKTLQHSSRENTTQFTDNKVHETT
ncbi:uncharacterized protein LOC106477282 [Limulus polyphemus]|uniref:Uncharacterized protein LOC106477282 n=1 Tax=Limulus polyphemus TaxID=6850 RepID=A0ABM1RZ18_LIMPO|nr:uncharacterized protein LOC106477282 [Limulus polyphemus]